MAIGFIGEPTVANGSIISESLRRTNFFVILPGLSQLRFRLDPGPIRRSCPPVGSQEFPVVRGNKSQPLRNRRRAVSCERDAA